MLKKIINSFIYYKHPERSDRVIYLVLMMFLSVSLACLIITLSSSLALGDRYHGVPITISITLTFLVLLATILFRLGYTKIITYFLLLFLLFVCTNIIYASGPENEFALLLMVFYIIVSAISLTGISFGVSILALFLSVFGLGFLEVKGIIAYDLGNKTVSTNFADLSGIIVIMAMIVFISWLFNHEINSYIAQLRKSQKMLQKERDLLEIKVDERTQQLQKEQAEKIAEFSKFAEFGRLAQGIFHDLINHLTALSLNLDQIKKGNSNIDDLNDYIEGATAATDNMDKLIDSTRNYFQHKVEKTSFSLADELKNVQQILHFKAEKAGVKLIFQNHEDVTLYGNKTRFSQLLGNLVINAIEAYSHPRKDAKKQKIEKAVSVEFFKRDNNVFIHVKDNACGMSKEIKEQIFKPFFSTKENNGNTGIGLTMCKDIVETEFMGKISIKSELNMGTEFVISLPQLPFE